MLAKIQPVWSNRIMNIIDFHTHAFPDKIAGHAIKELEKEGTFTAVLNGTLGDLLKSMDKAGICASVIAMIATKPEQFAPILKWSEDIRSDRIIPFPSIHPDDPEALEHIQLIARKGFKGIKLHPYYQGFVFNEPKMFPIYEQIQKSGLIFLAHTGFDCAFDRVRICDPVKIYDIMEKFPGLKLVCSHLGAWEDWEEAEKYLIGKPVYMELSFSNGYLDPLKIKSLVLNHPKQYLLFGTDSPWADQLLETEALRKLELGSDLEELIFYSNARNLLNI